MTWIYVANGKLDEPLQGLAANQTYHLTLHTTPGEAFRLDPAAADLEVVLYTPYHNNIYDPRPILATNIGTVQLGGQNVTGSPLGVNLRDEGGFEGEVSVSAPATYARVMTDPEQQALVTDLTFDFTLPADFDPASPMGPLEFDAVALAGTETLPAGQVLPEIAGFAHVPEPLMLAPLALAGLVLLGRRPRTRQ